MKTPPQRRRYQPQETDVQAARGRLRGALNDSLQGSEANDISEDYEDDDTEQSYSPPPPPPAVVARRPQRGRPRKIPATAVIPRTSYSVSPPQTPIKRRRLRERETPEAPGSSGGQNQKIQAESFVMKLFDRSLDLSKYSEKTALYPMCRAWMANQPRNPSIRSYREARSPSPTERIDNGGDVLLQLRQGKLRDITTLPKPKKPDTSKIPPQIQPQTYGKADNIFEEIDEATEEYNMEELLKEHVGKWKCIKKNWQKHTRLYQQRNDVNFLILQELFKP